VAWLRCCILTYMLAQQGVGRVETLRTGTWISVSAEVCGSKFSQCTIHT
jgi:hypothetical protein